MVAIVSPSPIIFHTPKLVSISPSLRRHRHLHLFFKNLTVKCTTTGNSRNPEQDGSSSGGGDLKEALSGIVDSRVDELLNKEENRALLDGLNKASERVERAKRELAAIEKQEIEAKLMRDYISHLESRTSEIAECQREILEAKTMVEEAQQSLSAEDEEINRKEERLESAKAASVSALVGTLAGLPIYLSQVSENSQLILPLAVTFISCALFGVTFRYVVRRDLDDFQLKTGAAAGFGVVKGLATLESGPPLELEIGSFISYATKGAVYVAENLLIFIFAVVALDFCFKIRVLSPFPIQKSASEAKRR